MDDNGDSGRRLLFNAKISVGHHFSKKNSNRFNPRTGSTFRNSRSNQAENHLLWQLRSHAANQKIYQPFGCYLHAVFKFHFDNFFTKKSLKKTRKNPNPIPEKNLKIPDLSNLYQGVEDCLQKAGIIVDDHFIASHDGSRRIASNENYLEIFLYRFED